MEKIKLGKYKHYKGKYYKVMAVAKHSETSEELVIYQALYDNNQIWARPLTMFTEKIKKDGKIIPRFEYVENQ